MRDFPLSDAIGGLDPSSLNYATQAVEHILAEARRAGASDVHLRPTPEALDIHWRIDGVLNPAGRIPGRVGPNVVARLKVLADLLGYRTDVPQEGRIRHPDQGVEMRLCTFPTLHGEKAVIRVFGGTSRFSTIRDLGWPEEVETQLGRQLDSTSGAIVFSGPAGSGKTTSLYAALRELATRSNGGRSISTLEDPIESAIPGVSQTQVVPASGLTLETGLRAMLRQDPEVIAIGEIRDRETAEVAIQASLTGHLILTTFHAGSACEVIGRLIDMGIEPYMIRSGIVAVIGQRLVRRLCGCARESDRPEDSLGLVEGKVRLPAGCPACRETGYLGRAILAEMLVLDEEALGRGILERRDVRDLESLAIRGGMVTRRERARRLIAEGITSPTEIIRVLGTPRD